MKGDKTAGQQASWVLHILPQLQGPLTPRQHPLGLPEGTVRLLPAVDLHRRSLPPPGQDLRADEAQRGGHSVSDFLGTLCSAGSSSGKEAKR